MKQSIIFTITILLIIGCKTNQVTAPLPCESKSQTIYKSNNVVYCGCVPIKKLPEGHPSIEVFIFDMSKPEGEKRILNGTISANKDFKINLESLELRAYWFGYRVLGDSGNIDVAQFVLKPKPTISNKKK